jgi:hypothetical protein
MKGDRIVDRIRRCTHDRSISVIADGLERVICEGCGDITIRYESMISGDITRSQFARKADALHDRRRAARALYAG